MRFFLTSNYLTYLSSKGIGHLPNISRDFTATTFIVENERTLLLWHRKVGAWLPPGGHIEQNELPEEAARREVREETGLEVELLAPPHCYGKVRALHNPVCILLEDITEDHQHIDLIYFARITAGSAQFNPREASQMRWYSRAELEERAIAEDIRLLGQQAIAACFPSIPDKS
jgi:ADP-ribose pyrophosphatase YjhB (NUDIX family)